MKVVFPCPGSIVLLKQDLDTLKAFYNTSLITSKMNDIYKTSNSIVQVGNFNYIPPKNVLVLHKVILITIEKMRGILGLETSPAQSTVANEEKETSTTSPAVDLNNTPISDSDLLSNPFFQTLRPL